MKAMKKGNTPSAFWFVPIPRGSRWGLDWKKSNQTEAHELQRRDEDCCHYLIDEKGAPGALRSAVAMNLWMKVWSLQDVDTN